MNKQIKKQNIGWKKLKTRKQNSGKSILEKEAPKINKVLENRLIQFSKWVRHLGKMQNHNVKAQNNRNKYQSHHKKY